MGRYIDAEEFLKKEIDRCGGCRPIVGTGTSDNRYLEYCLQDAETLESMYVVIEDFVVDYEEFRRIRFVSFSESEAETIASEINKKRGSKYAAYVIELDIGDNFVSV